MLTGTFENISLKILIPCGPICWRIWFWGPTHKGNQYLCDKSQFFNVNAPLCAYCTFPTYPHHHAPPSPHPCRAAASSVVSAASSSRLWEQQGPQYKHSVSLTAQPFHEPCELTLPPRHLQAAKISNWCATMFREFTLPAPYTSFTVTTLTLVTTSSCSRWRRLYWEDYSPSDLHGEHLSTWALTIVVDVFYQLQLDK